MNYFFPPGELYIFLTILFLKFIGFYWNAGIMALWWIPPLSLMTFYVSKTINIFAAVLCIGTVSFQPFSLMSRRYISIPVALKISRGHQILSPPPLPRAAGVARRGPWNTPLDRFEEDRWPAAGQRLSVCEPGLGICAERYPTIKEPFGRGLSPRRRGVTLRSNGTPGTINMTRGMGWELLGRGVLEGRGHEGELMPLIGITGRLWEAAVRPI